MGKIDEIKTTAEELRALYYSTDGITAVQNTFNISSATAYKLLKKYDVQKNRERNKEYFFNKVPRELLELEYFKNNHSVRWCATHFGVTHGEINNLLIWYYFPEKTIQQRNETRRLTDLEKYGTENSSQNETVKATLAVTKLEKYGNAYFTNYEKAMQTNLNKYGVKHVFQVESTQIKIKETMLDKFGVQAFTQTLEYHKKARKKYYYNNISFDSLPELAVYIYAIDHDIKITRLPKRLSYNFNNKKHYYLPDFLYDGKLLEIKNDYLFNKLTVPGTLENAKYICMQENSVESWTHDKYKFAIDYFKSKNYTKEMFMRKIYNV